MDRSSGSLSRTSDPDMSLALLEYLKRIADSVQATRLVNEHSNLEFFGLGLVVSAQFVHLQLLDRSKILGREAFKKDALCEWIFVCGGEEVDGRCDVSCSVLDPLEIRLLLLPELLVRNTQAPKSCYRQLP